MQQRPNPRGDQPQHQRTEFKKTGRNKLKSNFKNQGFKSQAPQKSEGRGQFNARDLPKQDLHPSWQAKIETKIKEQNQMSAF